MKAIIMAGGEGKRLRPVSSGCPKPMARLLGRPLMEHIVELLRSHGFDELCVTLCSRPEAIRSHFGDGRGFGVSIVYSLEREPLGTAGGVRRCLDFAGGEPVLVISGDAACDFDLASLMAKHRASGAAVTMALAERSDPLRYGLVLTDAAGRVSGFIEKPDWSRVVTNRVNTGIYILSPEAIEAVPPGREYDFGKDLFPELLRRGALLRGELAEGYWCDVGTPEEYLRCSRDALRGELRLRCPYPEISPGMFCASRVPESARLTAPCVVAEGVYIGEGAQIGPEVSISPGSAVCAHASVRRSVIDGGAAGARSSLDGVVLCRGGEVAGGVSLSGGVIAPPDAEKAPERAPLAERSAPEGERLGEIPCRDRARLMRLLSEATMEAGADFADGLVIRRGGASVRVSPSPQRSALRLESCSAQRGDAALAGELIKLAARLEASS